MGRSPSWDIDADVKKGPWTTEEDNTLVDYIEKNGSGNWRQLPKKAGLNRCGKSCRLRWTNYLRPDIKRGMFSEEEERLIIHFHSILGNKWSQIAGRLPGRTDNEIKNYWNTCIRKKLLRNGIDPVTHRRRADLNALANLPHLISAAANLNNFVSNPLVDAIQLQKLQLVQTLIQIIKNSSFPPNTGAMSLLGSPFAFQNLNQPLFDVHSTGTTTNTTDTNSSFMSAQTANTMPSLVPNSSANFPVDQAPDLVNLGDVSSGSSPFESWRGLNVDDLNIDFGWKDVLEQISWSNPFEQEMEISKK